ncbi:MAG TPA: glycosyltransferase family 4 protein [Propionibacteriaceae bacterium]|nr:glycosyltransferase family 4 protein [Propionibacteriaceae bacterium]
MRIAQVLTASTGGIGRHVASLVPRLVQRGHAVRVFCPPLTATTHELAEAGADVRPLGDLLARGVRGAEVVHAHGYKAAARAWAGARLAGPPLVVSWHNAVLPDHPARGRARLLQRLVARGADLTLGASADLVAEAQRLGARRARLLPVAAPPVPVTRMSRRAARAALGVAPAEVLVLTVARLAPQKNLGLVLDVAAALRDHRGLRFAVAGEGPEQAALAERIATERLPVTLLGHRDDLGALLAAADIALLTSTWEARALVAQEALLAGLPLVSTAVGGVPDLVGDAAILVPPGNPAAAARAVAELADDPAERARLADAGRRQAATWPTEDDVVTELLTAYADLVRAR